MSDNPEKQKKNRPDHLYKPGQSGNPGGRPKGSKSYVSALRNYLNMTPKKLYSEMMKDLKERDDISVREACALLDAAQAMMRSNSGQRQLNIDRTEGKVKQSIEVDSPTMMIALAGPREQRIDESGKVLAPPQESD